MLEVFWGSQGTSLLLEFHELEYSQGWDISVSPFSWEWERESPIKMHRKYYNKTPKEGRTYLQVQRCFTQFLSFHD
jgi:hypothetical protein